METRSFADYLRTLDDAALISLFSHRPDLVAPVPPDVASLAVRATSAPSLARAIDALNHWQFFPKPPILPPEFELQKPNHWEDHPVKIPP